MTFVVRTQDVDGRSSRTYKTRAAALKRFEEMVGYTVEAAIEEAFYDYAATDRPTRDTVRSVAAVSMYGTRVAFAARSLDRSTT